MISANFVSKTRLGEDIEALRAEIRMISHLGLLKKNKWRNNEVPILGLEWMVIIMKSFMVDLSVK